MSTKADKKEVEMVMHRMIRQESAETCRAQWNESPLKEAVNKYMEQLPKDNSRMPFIQSLINHVRAHKSDPKSWLAFLVYPPWVNRLKPYMIARWKKGLHIAPVYDRFVTPVVKEEKVKKDSKTESASTSSSSSASDASSSLHAQKLSDLYRQKAASNQVFLDAGISEKTIQDNQIFCHSCKKPFVDDKTRQVRSADEGGTVFVMCAMCTSREKA